MDSGDVSCWMARQEGTRFPLVRQKPKLLPDYIVNDLLWVDGKVDVIKGGLS